MCAVCRVWFIIVKWYLHFNLRCFVVCSWFIVLFYCLLGMLFCCFICLLFVLFGVWPFVFYYVGGLGLIRLEYCFCLYFVELVCLRLNFGLCRYWFVWACFVFDFCLDLWLLILVVFIGVCYLFWCCLRFGFVCLLFNCVVCCFLIRVDGCCVWFFLVWVWLALFCLFCCSCLLAEFVWVL